jgi:hypothetical protein
MFGKGYEHTIDSRTSPRLVWQQVWQSLQR